MTKVLLVSNDIAMKNLLFKALSFNSFRVCLAKESSEAWRHLEETRFDFIMLDTQLSGESGLAFYKSLRQLGNNIPVMMIGEGELDSFLFKDLALENYDFILKPIKFGDVQEKINSFLQRNSVDERLISFGELKIDSKQQLIIFKDKLLRLGKMELDILLLLAQKGGEAVHPKKITKLLEREGKFYTMSTFYCISKLRNKLKKYGDKAFDICFVKDEGYRLELQF